MRVGEVGYARAQIVELEVMEKRLGSLPVIAEFSRRLDIAGVVDRVCPIRDIAYATHGQVIEVLIANRLTSPKAMVGVMGWAKGWAVAETYGVRAGILDDDRLARALDAIAPHTEQIIGSVGAKAIDAFGIDVARLHWDMTSISLYGAYDTVEEQFPAPGYGHPKDRRTDLKQIQAGIAVSTDGGIPVWHRAYDGGAGEVAQVVDAMTHLKTLAGTRDFLMIGDSKLISYGNVTAMAGQQVTFIAPLAAARVPQGLFAGLDLQEAAIVEYVAQRDEGKPADKRCVYRVLEDVHELAGPRKSDPVVKLRRILVHATANQQAAERNRATKLERARHDLDKLTRTAGSRHYPDHAAVASKAADIARTRKVLAYPKTDIGTTPDGTPTFAWSFDHTAIDAEAETDGWYALLTNLHPATTDTAEILRRYKAQPMVERRYGTIKGPLAVAPIFLQHNRRITALITIICLALLIFCLIEREVRKNLAPETDIVGFYPQDNRGMRPTTRLILETLNDWLRLIPAHHNRPPKIPKPGWLQQQQLDLLDVDITRIRRT